MKLSKTVLANAEKLGQFPGGMLADWPMSGKDLDDV